MTVQSWLNNDDTNAHAKVDGGKAHDASAYTENYRQLRNAEVGETGKSLQVRLSNTNGWP